VDFTPDRGSKPKWVKEHLAAGGTLEQMKV